MEKILLVPHPKLRQKAENIEKVTEDEIDISKRMTEIMKNAPGVGLAANQIGILKKIIVVHIKDEDKNVDKIYSLFNPKIKFYSKETVILEEGCLSFPQQFAEIERPSSIVVQYINEKNDLIEVQKDGYEARILQHEIDHLSGKLFVDYLSSLKRNIIIKKVKKLIKSGDVE